MTEARPSDIRFSHKPVLLAEVLAAIRPADGGVYVDGTFGAGGYSRGILEAASCRVYGIDRDETAVRAAGCLEKVFAGRLKVVGGRYGDMAALIAGEGVVRVDGVTLDVGVSSMQLDRAERGFSFRLDGPLDMRMGQSGPTAADLVSGKGTGRYHSRLRRGAPAASPAPFAARSQKPFARTLELAEVVRSAMPMSPHPRRHRLHPDLPGFAGQVNDELGVETRTRGRRTIARPGRTALRRHLPFPGRPDRQALHSRPRRSRDFRRPSYAGMKVRDRRPSFIDVSRKVVTAGGDEILANPRARSAKLRVAERTDAPSFAGGLR